MQTFLELTAKYVYEKYKENISELCVVLPSRRASFFFKNALAQAAPEPIWSPEVAGMEDFINRLAGVDVLEPINLQLELYDLMREQDPQLDFDQYISWGATLLDDFSRIDQHLVDTDKLFDYLSEAKALERWDPAYLGKGLSPTLKKYFSLWDNIEKTYHHLRNHLDERRQAYTGMAYRKVAENIEQLAQSTGCRHYLFIGLNALTNSEEHIIRTLLRHNKAEVLFDSDAFYMEDGTPNRAGSYLRKYKSTWKLPEWRWQQNLLLTDSKEINVIGVANASMQGKLVGQLLREVRQRDKHAQVAVVLPDETMLLPVLHAIPAEIPNYNVTMGLSFKGTPLYNLIDLLFDVHLTGVTQLHESGYKVYQYHHLTVTKLLSHPFVRRYELYLNEQAEQAQHHGSVQRVLDQIVQDNRVLITANDLLRMGKNQPLFEVLFTSWADCDDIIASLYKLIELLRNIYTHQPNTIETEYLYIFHTIVKRLDTIFDCREHKISVRSFRRFLNELIGRQRLPFSGEPISDLQVMGMLETRALDFENLIILSVNENTLPAPKRHESLMPYDVLKQFGLPTYAETEGAMAYNFYRLLQRAKNISLIYVLPSDTYGAGEKSRFILQLEHDLALRNPNIKLRDLTASVELRDTVKYDEDIVIQKEEQLLEQLRQELKRGLYPSHLNMYVNCSLQYYFTRIAKIREIDEVEEQLGADQFGTIVHQVLEDFFRPFEQSGQPLQKPDVTSMLQQLQAKVEEEFKKVTRGATPSRGMNYLLYKVAVQVLEKYLKSLLDSEDELPLYILRLEEQLETTLQVQVGDARIPVKVAGKADRIDLKGTELRVIDYKTGKVERNQVTVKADDLDQHFIASAKYDKARQLWLYEYILKRNLQQNPGPLLRNAAHLPPASVQPKSGILSFRNLDAGVLTADFPFEQSTGQDFLAASEEFIGRFVRELLDPNELIRKTKEIENCQYCPYRGICAR